jgi:hypothetical protein
MKPHKWFLPSCSLPSPRGSKASSIREWGEEQGGCSVMTLCYSTWTSSLPPNASFSPSLSIHGINEKISVQAYETQVKFIFELIQNADTYTGPVPHVHEL